MLRQYLSRRPQALICGRRKARPSQFGRPAGRVAAQLRVEALEARELPTAYPLAFNVNQQLSVLTLAGYVSGAYGADIKGTDQDPTALTTHYHGALNALYDPTAKTFQFVAPGSTLAAVDSGSWRPLPGGDPGYAPANYGTDANFSTFFTNEFGSFALRGLTGSLAQPNPVSVVSGLLPSNETVQLAGTDDYRFQGDYYTTHGTTNLSASAANNQGYPGQFQDLGGGVYHVSVPIHISFSKFQGPSEQANIFLSGTLDATGSFCSAAISNGVLTAGNTGPAATLTLGHTGSATTICGASFADNAYSSVAIQTGTGRDTVSLEATLSGKPVTVNEGSGGADVNLSPSAHNLNNIQGALTVHGHAGAAGSLTLNDQNNGFAQTFTLGANTVARSGAATITYDGQTSSLTVNGGNGGNTFNVQALASPSLQVKLNTGAYNDAINVGVPGGSLSTIQSDLTIDGQGGVNTLSFYDDGNGGAGQMYSVGGTTVYRPGIGIISYSSIQFLNVHTGFASNDVADVISTGPATTLIGNANLTVNVGSGGKTNAISGDLTITDPPVNALATVNVDDSTDGSFKTATLDTVTITGLPYGRVRGLSLGDIMYRKVDTQSATVQTGTGGALVDVQATVVPTSVVGHATGTVNVGAAGSVQQITADLTISDPPPLAYVSVNIDDSGDGSYRDVTLDQTDVGGRVYGRIIGLAQQATIEYSNADTSGISVYTGAVGPDVSVLATARPINLIGFPSGPISLYASDAANTWTITGHNAGTLSSSLIVGPVTFSGAAKLIGGNGADTFVFADQASVDGAIDGGGGTNTLDYSAYSTSVLVDLQTGSATGVGAGIANIQIVTGGTGGGAGIYNILVGNGGNVLTGGDGRRNLLIAGASASTLIGGNDDDILIGGTTSYDQEAGLVSLQAIMNYWSVTADDYGTRVANLLSGNGVPLLDATMVFNNGGGNTLLGNHGGAGEMNLFYGLDPALETTDVNQALGEQFINC
jgi:hypothetical protein